MLDNIDSIKEWSPLIITDYAEKEQPNADALMKTSGFHGSFLEPGHCFFYILYTLLKSNKKS